MSDARTLANILQSLFGLSALLFFKGVGFLLLWVLMVSFGVRPIIKMIIMAGMRVDRRSNAVFTNIRRMQVGRRLAFVQGPDGAYELLLGFEVRVTTRPFSYTHQERQAIRQLILLVIHSSISLVTTFLLLLSVAIDLIAFAAFFGDLFPFLKFLTDDVGIMAFVMAAVAPVVFGVHLWMIHG